MQTTYKHKRQVFVYVYVSLITIFQTPKLVSKPYDWLQIQVNIKKADLL